MHDKTPSTLKSSIYETKIDSMMTMDLPETSTPESASELTALLQRHERWLNSIKDPKVAIAETRAFIRSADLSKKKFSHLDLRGIAMESCNLNGADFSDSDLSYASLKNSDLRDTNFTRARLKGADLSNARLEGADFTGAVYE